MTVAPFSKVGPPVGLSMIAAYVTYLGMGSLFGRPTPGTCEPGPTLAREAAMLNKPREAAGPVGMNPFFRHLPATYTPK